MAIERNVKTLLALLSAEQLPGDPDIWTPAKRQAATSIMWNDLKSRALLAGGSDGHATTLRGLLAWSTTVPHEPTAGPVADGTKPTSGEDVTTQQIDVLIIFPLAKELNAALIPFGINPDGEAWRNLDGHKIYRYQLDRETGRTLTVAISAVNKARNVPMALATTKLIGDLGPSTVLMCGIGGGVRAKTELGDVIVATSVRDIAGGRDEVSGRRMRDETFNVPTPTDRQLNYFYASPKVARAWRAEVEACAEALRVYGGFILPPAPLLTQAKLDLMDGIIVAGETLVADGSLPSHLEKRDDRIRSCDMEGSGFAQAAQDRDLQWAVFRGISDFGDPDKTNEWQAVAAANAALAARMFLASEFRLRIEMTNTGF